MLVVSAGRARGAWQPLAAAQGSPSGASLSIMELGLLHNQFRHERQPCDHMPPYFDDRAIMDIQPSYFILGWAVSLAANNK